MHDSELRKLLLDTCPVRPGQEDRAWAALREELFLRQTPVRVELALLSDVAQFRRCSGRTRAASRRRLSPHRPAPLARHRRQPVAGDLRHRFLFPPGPGAGRLAEWDGARLGQADLSRPDHGRLQWKGRFGPGH